ncbi:MAG: hypothetical protein GY906_39035 [bacterium]|nr:hypothetical protein [bacterium]
MTTHKPLTAYRVTYSDGQVIATSMAADVTPKMARAYFIGQQFEMAEDKPMVTAVKVEPLKTPASNAVAQWQKSFMRRSV